MGCRCGKCTIRCQDNSAYCPQCELQRATKYPLAWERTPQRHILLPLPLACCWEGKRALFVIKAQKLSFRLSLLHIHMQKLGTIISYPVLVSLFLMTCDSKQCCSLVTAHQPLNKDGVRSLLFILSYRLWKHLWFCPQPFHPLTWQA